MSVQNGAIEGWPSVVSAAEVLPMAQRYFLY